MTGALTTRLVTASAGSTFVAGDANINLGSCSYIQTPSGLFPITAFGTDQTVTITVPAGYANDTSVAFSIWYKLFQVSSAELTTTTAHSSTITAQPSFALGATDKLGLIYLGAVTSGTHTISYVNDGNTQYTHFNSPLVVRHNDLAGLQGGSGTEFYHLTSAEHTVATQAATSGVNGYLSSTDWSTFNGKAAQATGVGFSHVNNGITDPAARAVNLASSDVTGILAAGNGGTGNAFTQFTGPTTSIKTFTLPDSSQTLLYSGGALGTPSSGNLANCTFPFQYLNWSEVTGTSQAATINSGYICNNAGLVTVTLPSSAAQGTMLSLAGKGAGGWKLAQNAGQNIRFGSVTTTTGVGGYLSSYNQYDAVTMVCSSADVTWVVVASQGNITYA